MRRKSLLAELPLLNEIMTRTRPIDVFVIKKEHTDKILRIVDSCKTKDHFYALNKLFDNKAFITPYYETIRRRLIHKHSELFTNA